MIAICISIHPVPFRSSRIFYGPTGNEYGTRDRCREDFYTLASTPIPLSDVEAIGSAAGGNGGTGNSLVVGGPNMNIVGPPMPNQSLQQSSLPATLQKQSPSTQANVSSVFYTVQRVITTSQIQTSGAYVSGALPPNHDCNQSMLHMSQGKIEHTPQQYICGATATKTFEMVGWLLARKVIM